MKNIINIKSIKDIINSVLRVYCSIILILAVFFVGSPLRNNFILVNIVTYIMAIIYLFTNSEKKIFSNKLDILIFVFCHSLIIPLIFGTEIKTGDTINNLLNNISVFWLYIVIKNLFVTEKQKKILLNTSLLCGIFLIILGIDALTTNYIWNIGNKYFDFINTANADRRLISSLGYANSLAAILGFNLFISWGLYLKNKDTVYLACIFVFLTGILLTYSRAVILIILLLFIFAVIILKNKEIAVESIIIFGISILFGLIYQKIFYNLQAENNYITIWLLLIIFTCLVCLVRIILKNIIDKFLNMNIKKSIIICILIIMFFVILVTVGLQIKAPLILYDENTNNIKQNRRIFGISENTKYFLEFDIDAIAKENSNSTYKIQVSEKNKYNDTIMTHAIKFDSIKEIKSLEFVTSSETTSFWIGFYGNEKNAIKLVINSLKINGTEKILEYKYMPTKIIERLEILTHPNKSTSERIIFIKDGLKIVQRTWLFGAGTDCWQKYYPEVQEYKYSANQEHCCPAKIWMESGIIGGISYIGILIGLSIIVVKHRKDLSVFFMCLAIQLIHIHGLIDFDLAFKFIYLISIALIGLMSFEEIKIKEKRKKVNIIWIPVLVICCFYCILNYKIENTKQFSYSDRELYLKLCPYSEKLIQIRNNSILSKTILSDEDSLKIRNAIKKDYTYSSSKLKKLIDKSQTIENIEFAYEQMKEYQERQMLNLATKNQLNEEILSIANKIVNSEYKIKFCQLILDYKEKNLEEIRNSQRNRYNNEDIQKYEAKFISIINEAQKVINNTEQ